MGLWNRLQKGYKEGQIVERSNIQNKKMLRTLHEEEEAPSKVGILVGRIAAHRGPPRRMDPEKVEKLKAGSKRVGTVALGVLDSITGYGPAYGSANAKSARKKRPVTPSKKATTGAFLVPIKPKAKPRRRKAAPKKNSFYGF